MEIAITLTDEQVDAIATRVAELLPAREPVAPEPLLTVHQLAELLDTSADWVRRHQAELGGYRLSEGGGQNPIRFRATEVERFLAERRLRPPARVKASANGWREDPDWALG
jgi:hypothetical protein